MPNNSASLLPPNASHSERDIEAATARLAVMPVPLRELWNPDTCPLALLPWLAWAYSVDQWDAAWTEAQKREAVKNSLFIHRHKGTLGAVERALSSLGYEVHIVEWFDDNAAPYTFRIDVKITDTGIDEPMYAAMARLINDAKNVRSHLSNIRIIANAATQLVLAGASSSGEFIFAGPWQPAPYSPATLYLSVASFIEINLRTEP